MVCFNAAVLPSRMASVDEAVEVQRRAVAPAEQTSHPALLQMRSVLTELRQMMKAVPPPGEHHRQGPVQ
jgi:hypothetical protein